MAVCSLLRRWSDPVDRVCWIAGACGSASCGSPICQHRGGFVEYQAPVALLLVDCVASQYQNHPGSYSCQGREFAEESGGNRLYSCTHADFLASTSVSISFA